MTSVAKKTLDASAAISPAYPRDANLPAKKSSIPPNAIVTATASRRWNGSFRTRGEKRSTQTTPQYWMKIALAAEVHLVASTNVVRHAA